jgi:alpha-glucosidase (family GH31 glycosyl hydrolase)
LVLNITLVTGYGMQNRRVFVQSAMAAAALGQLPIQARGAVGRFPARRLTRASASGGRIKGWLGSDRLTIQSPFPGIIQVDLDAHGTSDPHTPLVDPHAELAGDLSSNSSSDGEKLILRTASCRVEVQRRPFRIRIFDKAGHKLLDQTSGNGLLVDPKNQAANGFSFAHARGCPFYGITASPFWAQDQYMVLRDGRGVAHDRYQVEASVEGGGGGPLAWTTAGFGILVDCDGGFFQMLPDEIAFQYGNAPMQNYGRRYFRNNSLTVYILVGSPAEIMRGVSAISGRIPMFPKWAYGFINSQWGTNQEILRHYLKTYRAMDIPIDNFTLDFDWKDWGASHYGEFRWNPVKYSQALYPPENPDALVNWTRELSVKIAGIMKPRIIISTVRNKLEPMTTQGAAAKKLKIFAPGETPFADYFSHLPSLDLNFYEPICRQWYWHATWKHRCMQQGIAGFWNDEADSGILGNFEFLHMQQSLYEGQRRDLPNQRIWSINRNYYIGSQRYAYATWSGDINTGFAVMRQQTIAMVNTLNLGQVRWAQDTGGFIGHPTPECYTRWFQFTAVCPTLRTHCTLGERRQPWVFGDQACETVKFAIRRRYEWFPYVYACEHQCSAEGGVGIVRPMFYDYPNDKNVRGMSYQWMFGPWIMAAPVLHEMGTGKDQRLVRRIYLPPGCRWIDYFRGQSHPGGRWIDYLLNTNSWMDWPLFIKEGAVIPTAPPATAIHVANPAHIYVDLFPSAQETSGIFYDDDGTTFDYEKNFIHRQVITLRGTMASGVTLIGISKKQGNYQSSVKHFILRLHGRAATAIHAAGIAELSRVQDDVALANHDTGWYTDEDVYGPVTVIKIPAGVMRAIQVHAIGHSHTPKEMQRLLVTEASLSGPVAPDTPLKSTNGMYYDAHEFGRFGDLRNTITHHHGGYTGAGFIAGFNNPQTAATYYLCRRHAGTYAAQFHFANGSPVQRQTLNVYINGIRYGTLVIPGLANWNQREVVTMNLPLVAGANTVMLRYDAENTGHVNLDTVEFAMSPAGHEPSE